MDDEVQFVSDEFVEEYGDDMEEYLRLYPFPIHEFLKDARASFLVTEKYIDVRAIPRAYVNCHVFQCYCFAAPGGELWVSLFAAH